MMRWVRWLLALLAVIGLLWIRGVQAGAISPIISSASVSDHTVLRAFAVILSTSPPSIHPRADVLDVSAISRAGPPAGDGGPPWLDTRGPPASGTSPWVRGTAAGHAGSQGEEATRVWSR